MPSHDLKVMEETFLDQQELLVHNKQTAHEKMKGKRRLLKTVALSMAFFCLGLCVAIPGPTLIDLGKNVNRDTEHMTFIFTARSVGFLIGSLVGGVLFDYFDQQILLFYTLAVVAVATAGIPWCSALLTLSALICLQGVAIGVLDTGGNVFCIKIWGKRSPPFMQVLHFAFGIGAFLAPLIARPFLLDRDVPDNTTIHGYHPAIPLMSNSNHSQFIRDVFSQSLMKHGYAFDHSSPNFELVHSKAKMQFFNNITGRSQMSTLGTNITPSWRENHFFNGKIRWKKKNSERNKENHNFFNIRNLDSEVQKTDRNNNVEEIETQIRSASIKKQNNYNNDRTLNPTHADASFINSKLKDFKSNFPQTNLASKLTDKFTTINHALSNHRSGHLKKSHTDNTDMKKVRNNVAFVRIKRQHSKSNDTDKINYTMTHPKLLDNETGQILTSTTLKPTVATVRHFKPDVNVGTHLSEKHADGSPADKIIKVIKDNLPHDKPVNEQITPKVISTDHSLNLTTDPTEDENMTTVNQDYNSTGDSSISENNNKTEEKVILLPLETTSTKTTTMPATITTATTTTTESTIIKSTATSSLTTSRSTELMQPGTLAANTSLTKKPKATGEIIEDLVTSFSRMSKIQIAYPVIGLLLAINSGFFLFLHCKDRMLKSPLYTRRYQDPSRNPYTKCFVASIILLLFLFFLAYMGMEATFGGLLSTFAVNYTNDPWTSGQGASLTSLFWGCLAIGRGFSIFIARCIKPSNMIVMNLGTIVIAALTLSFGVPSSRAALWVGTVMLGLGMSSLFPTAILWANSCYPLSSSATAVFVAGCGVGEMGVPLLTGYLYENVSQLAVMYVVLFLSGLLSMLYLSIQIMVYRKERINQERSNSGFVRLKNMEEDEEESDLGVVEGINLGIMETTWRRRVHGEEEKRGEVGGKQIMEFTKLMEM